jgi:hypothetical protein
MYNPTIDATNNFQNAARYQANANIGLSMMATECGLQESDDTRQTIYLLRRTLISWAAKVIPVIYSLTESDGGNYGVMQSNLTPRASYSALQSLMAIISDLGGPGGSAAQVPAVVGWQDSAWPLTGCGVYGNNGAVLFVWQRTGYDQAAALSSALSTSGAITSIAIRSAPWAVSTSSGSLSGGTTITLADPTGVHTQVFTLASDINIGDTVISVSSQTPSYAFPTGSVAVATWDAIATPATYSAEFWIPTSMALQSITDVVTGSSLSHTSNNGVLTVSGISESPAAIIVT